MTERIELVLARIDERVKAIDEKLDVHKETAEDHEKRIRWNERFRNYAMGALLVSGSGLGIMEWLI